MKNYVNVSEVQTASIIRAVNVYYVGFQVITASSMKFSVFWDIAPCSDVEVDQHFRVY
jgi:hypothetical protein